MRHHIDLDDLSAYMVIRFSSKALEDMDGIRVLEESLDEGVYGIWDDERESLVALAFHGSVFEEEEAAKWVAEHQSEEGGPLDFGGPGSGNWGHRGRPGKRGGSLPRESGMSIKSGQDWLERYKVKAGKEHPFAAKAKKTKKEKKAKAKDKTTNDQVFQTAAKSGDVSGKSNLGGGVNESHIVQLEGDGSGIFKPDAWSAGSHNGYSEVGAHKISELLDMGIVPDTVMANIDGEEGSCQKFIDGGEDLLIHRVGENLTDVEIKRLKGIVALDCIIGNQDRHPGNVVYDRDGKPWAIDHGHASWMAEGTEYVLSNNVAADMLWEEGITHIDATELEWPEVGKGEFASVLRDSGLSTPEINDAWDNFKWITENGIDI